MCQKLAELEKAMGAFASGFDPALLSAAQSEGVMERAARIEHMAATVKALAAARMCETELWWVGGDKTSAHMLARRNGQTVSGGAPPPRATPRRRPVKGTTPAHRRCDRRTVTRREAPGDPRGVPVRRVDEAGRPRRGRLPGPGGGHQGPGAGGLGDLVPGVSGRGR